MQRQSCAESGVGRWKRWGTGGHSLQLSSPGRRAAGNSTTENPTNRSASVIFEIQVDEMGASGTGGSTSPVGPDYSSHSSQSSFNNRLYMIIDSLNDKATC